MLLSNLRRLLLPRRNLVPATLPRLLSSTKELNSQVVLEPLNDREIIRVKGDDVVGFLQGLVTNNMTQLKSNGTDANSMYAMFLNKNGRVLYDTIIYSTLDPSTYLIECDARISNELRRLLRMYRVRRQIDVEQADREFKPWVVFNPLSAPEPIVDTIQPSEELCAIHDPRLPQLGMRVLTTPNTNWTDLSGYFSRRFDVEAIKPNMNENYRTRRYCYGIAEGVDDMPPGKCFPLEANGDILNGVSFNKGCYVGQELTARVYHTGVIRKRVMPLRLTANPPNGAIDVQTNAGAKIGKVLSAYNKRALALMRVDQALRASELVIDGDLCYVEKPQWWPNEFGKRNVAASND